MSKGIDYGLGMSNLDNETGIRYGVISRNSVSGDALDDIHTQGDNLTYRACVEESKKIIDTGIRGTLADLGFGGRTIDHIDVDGLVDKVWSEVEQEFNDGYEEQDDTFRYEREGYIIETSSLGLFVIKSPFYTFASFCSPCCPGAGDLDSPSEDGVKTYCLGPDWFDGEAPYTPLYVNQTNNEPSSVE